MPCSGSIFGGRALATGFFSGVFWILVSGTGLTGSVVVVAAAAGTDTCRGVIFFRASLIIEVALFSRRALGLDFSLEDAVVVVVVLRIVLGFCSMEVLDTTGKEVFCSIGNESSLRLLLFLNDEPLLSSVTVSEMIGSGSSSPRRTLTVGSKRRSVSAEAAFICCCWTKSELSRSVVDGGSALGAGAMARRRRSWGDVEGVDWGDDLKLPGDELRLVIWIVLTRGELCSLVTRFMVEMTPVGFGGLVDGALMIREIPFSFRIIGCWGWIFAGTRTICPSASLTTENERVPDWLGAATGDAVDEFVALGLLFTMTTLPLSELNGAFVCICGIRTINGLAVCCMERESLMMVVLSIIRGFIFPVDGHCSINGEETENV